MGWFRLAEMTARPEAIAAMNDSLDKVEDILKKWETAKPQITDDEKADVREKMDGIRKWIQEKVEEQDAKQPHEDPAFTSEEVPVQAQSLNRLVKKLSKKPKPKPEKKEEEKKENSTETDGESSEEKKDSDEDKAESDGSTTDDRAESGETTSDEKAEPKEDATEEEKDGDAEL